MKSNIKSVSKTNDGNKIKPALFYGILILLFLSAAGAIVSFADDTDIYRPKVRHNVLILMDSSGSMAWPIYENTINYAEFYDYVCVNRSDWTDSYDEINSGHGTSAQYYGSGTPPKKERTKIYFIYANAGYSSSLTGDAGNPSLSWYMDGSADMATYLNAEGELEDAAGKHPGDAGYAGRISTVDVVTGGETVKMITVDGARLPNGKDIALHDWRDNPDGSRIDNGLSGLVQAPGYYFSGYFYDGTGSVNNWRPVTDVASCYTSDPVAAKAVADPEKCYFFATGNYINMQMVFNLQVYAGSWKKAWSYCSYPPGVTYQTVPCSFVSKNYSGNAPKNYDSNADS
ncbi:MAG: hypothetical protein Q8M56_17695, partial [Desulfobacterales bacterium]|nr:hypothetical protein [Desulfobacterales bacterium]